MLMKTHLCCYILLIFGLVCLQDTFNLCVCVKRISITKCSSRTGCYVTNRLDLSKQIL